jgi:hypothetical protein
VGSICGAGLLAMAQEVLEVLYRGHDSASS